MWSRPGRKVVGVEHVRLGIADSATMFALMAKATEVRGPELKQIAPEMDRNRRERLTDHGFIDVHKGAGNAFVYALTDDGWAWCARELAADGLPRGSLGRDKTLYAVLAGLGQYLAASDTRLYEVFGAVATTTEVDTDAAAGAVPDDRPVRDQIITAYYDLAQRPGAWITITQLRAALPDIDRATLDAELVVYQREPGVSLIQQENRSLLSDADRAAAVLVGAQLCHLLAIEE